MKSRTSLLNKTLLTHFNGTTFWLTIVFMALNIIALPLAILITMLERSSYPDYSVPENFLYEVSSGQLIIGMIFAALLAMFLLNYLNSEASSDFMHSLPVKRSTMLLHALLVGLGAIVIPLVITAGIIFIESFLFIPEITVMEIFKWLLYAIFVHSVIFSAAIFTGFLVNGLFLHLQMILLALFLPLAAWSLIYATANVLYDGISMSFLTHSEVVLKATFPYVAIIQLYEGLDVLLSMIWGVIAIVLIALSFLMYKYRRNERVTFNFNFYWLKEILVATMTIVGMLALGMAVTFLLPISIIVTVIGFLIGAVVSYLIIEMLFQSSVRIQFRWQSIVLTVILIALFWIVFLISWSRYVNFIPLSEQVESAYVSTEYMYYDYQTADKYFEDDYLFSGNNEVIQSSIKAHEIAVEESTQYNIYDATAGQLNIHYKLKDGRTVMRDYSSIQYDSEAIKTANNINTGEYDIHSDFLANIKPLPEDTQILLGGMIEVDDVFIGSYKENLTEVKMSNADITNNTGDIEVSGDFDSGSNYFYGTSSIYNEAVIERVRSSEYLLSDMLYIDEMSEMYTVEIDDTEMKRFFEDYRELPIEELNSQYRFDQVTNENKSDIINQINNGDISADSNKLLIYSYPEYMEFDESNQDAAETSFEVLAIQ